jgi:hypothetical protein
MKIEMMFSCADCGVAGGVTIVSSHVLCVSSSSIATSIARRIIGRNIKKNASDVPPSYAMRRCSRTRRLRKSNLLRADIVPASLLSCISLPDATITSVPIYDFTITNNVELAKVEMELYYSCCGKSICGGCVVCLF